jgi:hypothetical protein
MGTDMTSNARVSNKFPVARGVPPEVQDCGKVRMGGAIRIEWMAMEFLKMLAEIVHFMPGHGV